MRQTLQRTDRGLEFVPPKTHRSSRPLPLSGLAVRALESQRVRQAKERLAAGEVWSDHGPVFASTIGTPTEPRNVNRRFEQIRAAAGLGWLHPHALRHAFATFLLDQGEELRTVMELLGHSTIRMTADTYGHVLPARARQAASAIGPGSRRGEDGVTAWLHKWLHPGPRSTNESAGGAQGTRTPNPCLAKAVLCQLS